MHCSGPLIWTSDTNKGVYIKNTALRAVLTKMRAVEFTASVCEQLLCVTAGHIGISFINSQSSREGLMGRGGQTRGDAADYKLIGKCSKASVAITTVTTQLP